MSITLSQPTKALLKGIVATLKLTMGDTGNQNALSRSIQIGVDERVPPTAAERHIGVYLSSMERETPGPIRKEIYNPMVAITFRKKAIPSDRRGVDLYTDDANPFTISMMEVVEGVIASIDGKLSVIDLANNYIEEGCGFQTFPLYLANNAELLAREVGPEHFYIEPGRSSKRAIESLEGYVIQLPFTGATRYIDTTRT